MNSVLRPQSAVPHEVLLHGAEAVFWDFDGVIKESVEVKTQGYVKLFLPFGRELAERVRQHHEAHGGVSRYEKIALYLDWAGEPVIREKVDAFCERFALLVRERVINAPWVPGVREYLLGHHAHQRFVLVTATPEDEIQHILQALNIAHCFWKVYGAPTLKACAIRDALQRLQCPPVRALVVGDSETDLDAAAANHAAFLLRRTALNQLLQERYSGPMFDDLSQKI